MFVFTVKPSSVLKKAVATMSLIAKEASLCYSPRGIYIEAVGNRGRMVAILRIDIEAKVAFRYRCNAVGRRGLVLKELYRALGKVNSSDWMVMVWSSNRSQHGTLSFCFCNSILGISCFSRHVTRALQPASGIGLTGWFNYDEMQLFGLNSTIDTTTGPRLDNCQYRSVVGIPSPAFIRILSYFTFHADTVEMTVTEKRVTFSTPNGLQKIVLKTKYQGCIIGGVENAFTISIALNFLTLFANAASQTPVAWILNPAEITGPIMLNIPVGSFLGNIMLHLLI